MTRVNGRMMFGKCIYQMSRNIRKRSVGHMRPGKIQSSRRIRQFDQNLQWVHFGLAKMEIFIYVDNVEIIRLSECVGTFESLLGTHVRYVFSFCGLNINVACH